MFQLNTFLFYYSQRRIFFFLFTKHMWIQSRSSNKNKKSFSRSILLSHSSIIRKILFNQVWIFSFGIRTLLLHFDLLSFFLFFHHSLTPTRFGPVESDPFHHWAKSTKKIRSIFRSKVLCEILGFFLFLYPYLVGRAFESIENSFFCIWMNRYDYIPIPSRYLGTELNPKLTG